MAAAFFYSNLAIQTSLSGSISNVGTSITVAATTGFPASFPYILALDFGGAAEELVKIISAAGTTLTIDPAGRGFGGTSAQSHSLGAVVRHVYNAVDATDFRTHEGAVGAVHGLTGNIVGTSDTQTLSNKTLTSPIITGTVTGGASYTSPILTTPTLSGTATTDSLAMTSAAALSIGADSILARPAANTLATTDTELRGVRTVSTNMAVAARVTGDTVNRWQSQASGQLQWGPGNAAVDTDLSRFAAGSLGTSGKFTLGSSATTGTALLVSTPITGTAVVVNGTGPAGTLMDLQISGTSAFNVSGAAPGFTTMPGGWQAGAAGATSVNATGSLNVGGATLSGTASLNNYLGIGGSQTTYKTVSTGRTSTIARTNDPHLQATLNANFVYSLSMWLVFDADAAGDIAYNWSFPAGVTMTWDTIGQLGTATVNSGSVFTGGLDQTGIVVLGGIGAGTKMVGHARGVVTTAASGGTLNFQWAQSASSGVTTTLQAGSWLTLTRVA